MFNNTSFGNTSFGNSSFGGTVGTTVRFVPITGTDTVAKAGAGGGTTQISTRHQNITAMKEYESKSSEELRLEDYAANRKVGQSLPSFGSNLFSTNQSTSSIFSSPAQNQTNIFGQPKTGLDISNTSNVFKPFGQTSSPSVPGTSTQAPRSKVKSTSGLGATSTQPFSSTQSVQLLARQVRKLKSQKLI